MSPIAQLWLGQRASEVMSSIRKELDSKKKRSLDNSAVLEELNRFYTIALNANPDLKRELDAVKKKAKMVKLDYLANERQHLCKAKEEIDGHLSAKLKRQTLNLDEAIDALEEEAELRDFFQPDGNISGASREDVELKRQLLALKEKKADLESASSLERLLNVMQAENAIMNKLFPKYRKEMANLAKELDALKKKCNIQYTEYQTASGEAMQSEQHAFKQQWQQQQPQQKTNMRNFNLTPEAKAALREALLSALRSPIGQIDAICLQRAIDEGLPKQAIVDAAVEAMERYQRRQFFREKEKCSKKHEGQELSTHIKRMTRSDIFLSSEPLPSSSRDGYPKTVSKKRKIGDAQRAS